MCCEDKTLLDDDYDEDCHELDTIDESILKFEFYDCDIDDYWAKGWMMDDDGFNRGDASGYNNRDYRCFPTRYRLKEFRLNKSLRRIIKRNADLKTIIRPFRPTEGKDDLYTAHRRARFDYKKERYTLRKHFEHLRFSSVSVMEICVFNDEKLIACSLFEVAEKSIYGNVAFWDIEEKHRGLGIFTALLEMQYAASTGKEFYYLNYYLKQDPNFQYKTRFPALELYDWDNERWVDFKDKRIEEMFDHKFRCRDDLSRDKPEFVIFVIEIVTTHIGGVIASALFGSRVNGTPREDSDYNVLILTGDPEYVFAEDELRARVHRLRETKTETRGAFKILRAFFKNGDEVEFTFMPVDLANIEPFDEEMRRIASGGMKILHDPHGILEKLQKSVAPNEQ
jgi:arginyl-tRNA--protein-N-Asp/Glu arginylyltransferase/predicted nucleotidyltransferase